MSLDTQRTTSKFVTLDVKARTIGCTCIPRYRATEFCNVLDEIARDAPKSLDVYTFMDNCGAPNNQAYPRLICQVLMRARPRDADERVGDQRGRALLGLLTATAQQRGVFRSVAKSKERLF